MVSYTLIGRRALRADLSAQPEPCLDQAWGWAMCYCFSYDNHPEADEQTQVRCARHNKLHDQGVACPDCLKHAMVAVENDTFETSGHCDAELAIGG